MSRDPRDRWADHPCEALSALIDGELAAGERAAVEAHLATCPVCRSLKEDVEVLRREVAAEPPPPVPADLAARIRGRLGERAPAPLVARPWWVPRWPVPMPAAAAAAAVVVATLAWMAWPGGRPPGVAVHAGDAAAHDAADVAGNAGPTDAPDAEALSRLRSLGYVGSPAGPPVTAPAPAPGLAQVPPPPPSPPKATVSRRQSPADLGRQGAEAKARAPESAADADAGTGDRLARRTNAYDHAGSRAYGYAGRVAADALESPEKTMKKDAAPAAEPRSTPSAFQEAAGVEAAAASIASPAPPDAPRPLDAPPYIVRLGTEDRMTVRVREYECTIPISPADARMLAAFGAAATPPTASVAASKAEAGAAPAAGPTAAVRPAAPAAGTPAPVTAAGAAGAVARPAEPAPVVLPPAARERVVYLVRERYRALLEERCGPLPR